MMNKNRKALASGVWYTFSDFLVKGLGLITTPIFTRLLSHGEFGLYNTYNSWLGIFSVITTLQLGSSFIRARYDFENDFDNYVFSSQVFSAISVLLWFAIVTILYPLLQTVFKIEQKYIVAMFLYILFHSIIGLFQLRERYFFKYKVSVAISLIVAISSSLLSVLLVLNLSDRLDGRIYGFVIPTILVGLVIIFYMTKQNVKFNFSYCKYALPICLPFIPHLLSLSILNSMDKIMITNMLGEDKTALYSAAYSCGALVTTLLTSMNTAFAPWIGEKLHENRRKEIHSFSRIYVSMFVLLAIFVMLLAPEILLIIGGSTYKESVYVIPPVACGCIFQFVYTMHVNVEQFMKKTVNMAIASMIAALINLLLNYIFIPKFGYMAAAYTTLVGYAWLMCSHVYLVYKIKCSDVYDYRFIVGAVLFSLVIMLLCNILYMYTGLRLTLVATFFCVLTYLVYKNKKFFINLINGRK